MKARRGALCLLFALPAVRTGAQDRPASKPTLHQLSPQEVARGWHLLFDGKSTGAWRGYKKQVFPAQGWVIQEEALHHRAGGGGGDLVTRRTYRNFELKLQWKVARAANSGIIYRASEESGASYMTGPEYQILDDGAYPKLGDKHRAGALYALYAPAAAEPKAAGEWNTARIVARGGQVQHWLNGTRVVTADLGSEDFAALVAGSKFAKWKRFAKVSRGHVCLQDHGNAVWYRDIKIRELAPEEERYGDPVVLFDGKNLDCWSAHLRQDAALEDVWSISAAGVLVCRGRPIGYLHTNDDFESFVLRLEWRFDPVTKKAGNSGVLLRMTGEHKVWPRSIEAQLHSGNAGDFWNIGQFPMQVVASRTRGRNTKKTHGNEKPIGEWNAYEIVVDGPWVSLRVNGEVLNEAWGCEVVPGKIGLQSEGAEIHFRNIRLHPLK